MEGAQVRTGASSKNESLSQKVGSKSSVPSSLAQAVEGVVGGLLLELESNGVSDEERAEQRNVSEGPSSREADELTSGSKTDRGRKGDCRGGSNEADTTGGSGKGRATAALLKEDGEGEMGGFPVAGCCGGGRSGVEGPALTGTAGMSGGVGKS